MAGLLDLVQMSSPQAADPQQSGLASLGTMPSAPPQPQAAASPGQITQSVVAQAVQRPDVIRRLQALGFQMDGRDAGTKVWQALMGGHAQTTNMIMGALGIAPATNREYWLGQRGQ